MEILAQKVIVDGNTYTLAPGFDEESYWMGDDGEIALATLIRRHPEYTPEFISASRRFLRVAQKEINHLLTEIERDGLQRKAYLFDSVASLGRAISSIANELAGVLLFASLVKEGIPLDGENE